MHSNDVWVASDWGGNLLPPPGPPDFEESEKVTESKIYNLLLLDLPGFRILTQTMSKYVVIRHLKLRESKCFFITQEIVEMQRKIHQHKSIL